MSKPSSSISILLVDDQALLRQLLAKLLEQQVDFNIVGTASDGCEAIKQIALRRPDVVLLDIEMPNLNGLSATRLITQRFPETKIIVLSAHNNEVYLRNALKAGARAYLLKNTLYEELSDTVRLVHKGYSQFSAGVIEKMVAGLSYADVPANQRDETVSFENLSSLLTHERQEPVDLEELLLLAKLPLGLLDRFEPDEIAKLATLVLDFPDVAIALQPDICQRLARAPKNLALLYLHGTLAHNAWSQPEAAFTSLEMGFQVGLDQAIPPAALLLFYHQAIVLQPHLAFRWLTQAGGPWDTPHHLSFLTQEATRLFGPGSFQARSILLLNRMSNLKMVLRSQIDTLPVMTKVSA